MKRQLIVIGATVAFPAVAAVASVAAAAITVRAAVSGAARRLHLTAAPRS